MLSFEELELRKYTIGSSDVPAICGLSPWKRPGDVLQTKLDPRSIEDLPSFKLGHKLEQPIAEHAVELGLVKAVSLVPGRTVVRDDWKSATPDFYALRKGSLPSYIEHPLRPRQGTVMEIKVVGWRQLPYWGFGKYVPDYVSAQVQWQMMVLGHPTAVVVALLGGAEVQAFELWRDDTWIAELEGRCHDFWKRHLSHGERDKIWARVKLENLRRLLPYRQRVA